MKTFLIERDLEGISMPDLHGLVAASQRQVARMREEGDLVQYLGSTFLPAEGLCLCLYQAKDEAVLGDLNRGARLPVKRIVPAIALAQT
ncbi:MAG: nickel-binding protein [Tabrizicola sp.]